MLLEEGPVIIESNKFSGAMNFVFNVNDNTIN